MKRLFLFAMVFVLLALMVSGVSADEDTIKGNIKVNPTHTVQDPLTLPDVASRGVVRTQDEQPPPDPREPSGIVTVSEIPPDDPGQPNVASAGEVTPDGPTIVIIVSS